VPGFGVRPDVEPGAVGQSAGVDRVLIVDDNVSFRTVARVLLEAGGFLVAGEAGTVADAVRCAAATGPDVVLLDIGLPDGDGISACADLRAAAPAALIVFCSVRDEEQYGDAVARSPAVAFLTKSRLSAAALAAIVARARHGQRDDRR
jgi:DNA-binding NarL/FixJ family response regulator